MNELLLYDTDFSFGLLVPMVVALLCGGLIGAERTKSGRPAGVRTYALVCFASALAMAVANHPSLLFASVEVGQTVRMVDPTRIMQGVLSGVGFLGAGVIFREGFNVRGLTSASAIWAVSVVGILVGMGFVLGGVLATALTVVVLALSSRLDEWIARARFNRVTVSVDMKLAPKSKLVDTLAKASFSVQDTFYRKAKSENAFEYTFVVRTYSDSAEERLAVLLTELPGVVRFSISPNET
jgi:putative Mg2+ transporter-C (MgtC) family protein